MNPEIHKLKSRNAKLPKGTRIKTTQGGVHTGGDHELTTEQLASANKIVNGRFPSWIHAWADLHGDLFLSTNNHQSS